MNADSSPILILFREKINTKKGEVYYYKEYYLFSLDYIYYIFELKCIIQITHVDALIFYLLGPKQHIYKNLQLLFMQIKLFYDFKV